MTLRRAALLGVLVAAAHLARAAEPLAVAVSILPQVDFVTRIGGDHVEVQALVGPGQSPHTFEPTPRQLEYLARARLYFTIGIDFEIALLPRVQAMFKELKLVDTRAGVPLRQMSADELAAEAQHDHEPAHADHGAAAAAGRPDPHIWLNPLFVKIQARTICDALVAADPAHADDYRANLARFLADLDAVHAKLAAALAPLRGRELFVFHPAFGYFTDAYGLRQVPVEMEGKEPTARQLAQLIERAKTAGVKVIFVQPQMPRKAAEVVARSIGGAVVPMDDLPRDYLKNLTEMADKIAAALQPTTARAPA